MAFLAPSLARERLLAGAVAGVAGGAVFGALMTMTGMMQMVAMLVGSTSVAVGWVLHLSLSALFGVLFASALAPRGWGTTMALGMGWGVALWAVAAMLVMRTMLAMPLALDPPAMQSLAGHLLYGAVLGVTYALSPALLALRQPGGRAA